MEEISFCVDIKPSEVQVKDDALLDTAGAGAGTGAESTHSSVKIKKNCRYFLKPSGCSKGDDCPYIHDDGMQSSTTNSSQLSDEKIEKVCIHYARSRCRAGAQCVFLHGKLPPVEISRERSQSETSDVDEVEVVEFTGTSKKRKIDASALLSKYSMKKFAQSKGHENEKER
jgi:hypothetical protein